MSMSFESSDEDIRESGVGILEFSPAKAGQDITPAKFDDFESKEERKRPSGFGSSLVGLYFYDVIYIISISLYIYIWF